MATARKRARSLHQFFHDEKDYADYYGHHYYQVDAAKMGYSP